MAKKYVTLNICNQLQEPLMTDMCEP